MSTQCHVQSFLKHLQGCWFHHLSGHLISVLHNPSCTEIPLKAQPSLAQPLPLMSLTAREKRPIPTWPYPPVRSERGQELGFPLHRSIATRIYMQSNSMQVPGKIYLDLDQLRNLIFQCVYWRKYASQTNSHPNWQSACPLVLTGHQFSMASHSAYEIKTLLM